MRILRIMESDIIADKDPKVWVISGVSRLTGERQEISRAMTRDQAKRRLEQTKIEWARVKKPAYTRLRVERRLPTQLYIEFNGS